MKPVRERVALVSRQSFHRLPQSAQQVWRTNVGAVGQGRFNESGFRLSIEIVIILMPREVAWHAWALLAQYIVLLAAVLVIGFGTSWSYAIERLTGQQQKRYMR